MIPFTFMRQWPGKTLGRGFLALLLSIILGSNSVGAASPTAAPPASATLQLTEGKLTAQLTAASLHQVMDEIGRLSGARVVWLTPGSDRQVSATFTALPLHDALQQLLGAQGFLLLYTSAANTARLSQIWISSSGHRVEQARATPVPTLRVPLTVPVNGPTQRPLGQIRDTLIHQALDAPQQAARLEALHWLTEQQDADPQAQAALATVAAKTDDPLVQEAAEAALAEED